MEEVEECIGTLDSLLDDELHDAIKKLGIVRK
jgi:hypothetical protein